MFDYSIIHWMTFLSAAVLLNLSPGPDMAFILGQTLRSGRRHGVAAMLGIWSGTLLHVVMAGVGLSAVLATSALAFSVVKWVGAVYLVWLGIKMLFSQGDAFISDENQSDSVRIRSVYWQGGLVSALNPKVALFFLAFLPQFVVESAGSASAQLLLHGSLIIVVAAFIEPPLIVVGSKLGTFLRANKRAGLWMDRSLGALFIALGVRLAASTK
ncbi:Leucine efflux protein [Vibrio ruber DSM 16370]|uniref:Leucine efflux protein n=1 Tax=Vibrio ruber (strain DSM 16370 / JCM 11486 / BCRC 17186 / CECT 7878 / LMG 23124 / VR1) TaxID=1123498 RepID=A0A1R4LHU9_VIBR1|nr:LysE family translocator [Vibrio ruber]SJN56098.1 Leucine efflux protein [Vibrio ruber DSM 16370]